MSVELLMQRAVQKTRTSLCDRLRPQVTEDLLAEVTERVVDAFHPNKVILFGSYAYGVPHTESDIDLFIIMQSADTMHQRIVKVTEVARVPFLPMDVIVRTPEEVAQRIAMGDYFVTEILDKGRVLYSDDAV